MVAGHAPEVLIHARLADSKTTGAVPVKSFVVTTANAALFELLIRSSDFPSAGVHIED